MSIAQTVAYTITLDIPNAAEGYDKYPYFVKDVASKGLTVNKDFKAVVRAADGTETNMPFTYVTVPTVGADGKTTTVLEFDLANKSGQLVITYTAVVNKDIIDMGNKVTNKAVSRDTEVWNTPNDWGHTVSEIIAGKFHVFETEVRAIIKAWRIRLAESDALSRMNHHRRRRGEPGS